MNLNIRGTALFLVFIFAAPILNANDGEQLFKKTCAACHTIGQGKLVGPDLAGVAERRSQDWLISFIRSSTAVIRNGDSQAVAIFNEYNKLLMPDNNLSDAQIISIINYISRGVSPQASGENNAIADLLDGTTSIEVVNGLRLFSGKERLKNGGAACSACHKVRDERIFSSGILAKDLSESFDIMGSAGIAAILRSPPFPAMQTSYENHLLTEEEVISITAYLKSVSKERYYQIPSDFSISFALLGIFVFIGIFMITVILYFKRKKLAVNQHILDRPSKVIN